MAEYLWEARARSGELRKGKMEADSEETVRDRLRSMQLTSTKVARSFSLPSSLDELSTCFHRTLHGGPFVKRCGEHVDRAEREPFSFFFSCPNHE